MSRTEKRIPHVRVIDRLDIRGGMQISYSHVNFYISKKRPIRFRFIEAVQYIPKSTGGAKVLAIESVFNKGTFKRELKQEKYFMLVERRRPKKRGPCGRTA